MIYVRDCTKFGSENGVFIYSVFIYFGFVRARAARMRDFDGSSADHFSDSYKSKRTASNIYLVSL